jgi:hypothetical protein
MPYNGSNNMSGPWTLRCFSADKELAPPSFAPDAVLVVRIRSGSRSKFYVAGLDPEFDNGSSKGYCYSARVEDWDAAPDSHEFGWLVDSVFLMLAA